MPYPIGNGSFFVPKFGLYGSEHSTERKRTLTIQRVRGHSCRCFKTFVNNTENV